jgi:hypothetical protein
MAYDELAVLCGCSAAEVKLRVNHLSLDRRKSRERRLNLALTAKFFEMIKETEYNLDTAIENCIGLTAR